MALTRETSFGTECTREWHDLIETNGSERYCNSCDKHIIDFTKWSRDDLLEYFSEHSVSCGKFRIDQVEPSIVEIKISFPKKLFKSVFAFVTLLWVYDAKSQSTIKQGERIEFITPDCGEDSAAKEIDQRVIQNEGSIEKSQPIKKDKVDTRRKK